jgi:hypothetical protein
MGSKLRPLPALLWLLLQLLLRLLLGLVFCHPYYLTNRHLVVL